MMKSPGYLKVRRFFLTAALLLVCQPAFAEKRVALVLGNSAYQNVAKLPNPVNDGAMIAATLKDAGFDVVDWRQDLGILESRRALRDFADRARDADIAVATASRWTARIIGSRWMPNWSVTPTSTTRTSRWSASCWRSNPQNSFGW